MTFAACIAILLPGLAWWAWFGDRKQDPLISLANITGTGLSIIILTAQFIFLLGGSLSLLGILSTLLLCTALAVMGMAQKGMHYPKQTWHHLLAGLLLLGGSIGFRLFQARNLLLPNWVDSQHHFLIIRTIIEQGGLPHNLTPYLEMPFFYHYGFHASTALFAVLSGLEIGNAMLVFGQVLNATVALSVYTLAKSLWKDWRPAITAALLVLLVTRMPSYYLTWGRYTLITGLVLLPLAMAKSIKLMRKSFRWSDIATLGLFTAGILLSHYFAGALLAGFMVLVGGIHLLTQHQKIRLNILRIARLAGGAAMGFLLAAPWLWRVAQYASSRTGLDLNLPETVETVLSSSAGEYIWHLLGPTSNHWLLLPAGMGLLYSLVKRKALYFGLWTLSLAALTVPWTITIHPFRPDHFAIVMFLPVALWVGWFFWQVSRWFAQKCRRRWAESVLLLLFISGWIAWGIPVTIDIINPVTVLVTEDDIAALGWIAENTPKDARFYINSTYWLYDVYRGVDGGGWILPYTGRWALVPTIFYGFSPDAKGNQQLREWGQRGSNLVTCSDEFWELADEAKLDWVYLRTGVGSLKPEALEGCVGVEKMYANDSVGVFRLWKNQGQ